MRTENFTKRDGNSVSFRMVIEGEELKEMLRTSAAELQKDKELPGFRKGKIPLDIMLSQFGKEIYKDTANRYSVELFTRAVADNALEIVGEPYFIISSADPERMEIAVVVSVYPDVALHQYKWLEIPRLRDEVTEEELDRELESFRNLHRRVVQAERPAADDDIVYFSYAVECGRKSLPSGAGVHVSQRLDREEMFPGLKEKMLGTSAGDEFTLDISMPSDHKRADLAGKDITLFVRIEEVKERRLQPLTDELVSMYNKDCATVSELREKLRRERNRYLKMVADDEFENALKEKLAEQVEANIPDDMFELQLQLQYRNLENGLRLRGSSIERFMEENDYTPDMLREISVPTAKQEVRFTLAIEKIAEIEDFAVTDEEIAREYAAMARRRGVDVKTLKSAENDRAIIEDIRAEKAIKLVRDTAVAVYKD